MDEDLQPKVKSLYKALKLLDYFDSTHKETGVTELAEYSGLLKSLCTTYCRLSRYADL